MEYVKDNGDKVNVKGLTVTVELGDETMAKINEIRNEIARVAEENAKLRELVDELWEIAYGYAPHESELDFARDMMRELGIEVG